MIIFKLMCTMFLVAALSLLCSLATEIDDVFVKIAVICIMLFVAFGGIAMWTMWPVP